MNTNKPNCPCALPSATEQEIATIPGPTPGTAYRLRVEPGIDGYIRFEQMAYSTDLGWYTQKSFCLPGPVLSQLLPDLRKADCLIPKAPQIERERLAFRQPHDDHQPIRMVRRDA